jgi:hypothetical protein
MARISPKSFARDCRGIMMSRWYRRIFPTRLAPHRQAVQEFITTRQGYRLATSTGGVLTGRGANLILIDDPLKPEEALSVRRDHVLDAGNVGHGGWSPRAATRNNFTQRLNQL